MIKLLLRSSFAATQVDEMRGQRVVFDQKMARAVLDASGMKVAYDQLACDNAEQKQVLIGSTASRYALCRSLVPISLHMVWIIYRY